MDDPDEPADAPAVTDGHRRLARALLAGRWESGPMTVRLSAPSSGTSTRITEVVADLLAAFPLPPHHAPTGIAALLARAGVDGDDPGAGRPRARRGARPAPRPAGRPAGPAWPVPPLADVDALAAWLDLTDGDLHWLADPRGSERRVRDAPLRHYRYAWAPRRTGGIRVIEAPKSRLKQAQRQILHGLLVHIPVHDAAHGFRPGRSALTHARAHVGRRVVLGFDLRDFFGTIAAGRVFGILRQAGYPPEVAHLLVALTTNVVPAGFWASLPVPSALAAITAHHHQGRRLAVAHLPQGAPTSPALANLCAFTLDRRLAALAAACGGRYTRYADDLVISGEAELERRAAGVRAGVARIVRESGFALHPGKSYLSTAAGRQRVCGVVVNTRPNVPREEFDRLKALLHALEGGHDLVPDRAGAGDGRHAIDMRAHLRGRIDWLCQVNPARGARLRSRFDALPPTGAGPAAPGTRPS